ncbi:hypothetical protein ES708_27964 [subsurface metagenome]
MKGVKILTVTPRFAFGTKLYAGLPADEIFKLIVQAGKVTPDMVKGLDPAKVTQIARLLTNVAPALASEFSKIAMKIEIPKVEPKEPWQMTKKEFLGDTIWIESAKNEHIQSVVSAIREGKPVPEEVLKDYPELKVKPKPPVEPTIPKEKVRISARQRKKDGGKLVDIFLPKSVADKIPKNMEWTSKIKGLPKELNKYTMLFNTGEIQEVEAVEPTPTPEVPKAIPKEPIISKEEVAPELKRVIEIKEETEKSQKKLIDERVLELKEEGFKGVEKGGVKRDEEGEVIGRYPAISFNPKWYRDFYAEHKKSPTSTDLKEIAKEQLLHGHEEDYGVVPPSEIYQRIDSQIESYDTIIDTLRERKIPTVEKVLIKPVKTYELKKDLTPSQRVEGNKMIGRIQGLVHSKGLTKVEFTTLKRKYGESPHFLLFPRKD